MAASDTGPFGGFTPILTPFKAMKVASRNLKFNECVLNGGCRDGCQWSRTDGTRLPWDPQGAYGGWGGSDGVMPVQSVERTPVVFVHGNQRDACDWETHRARLRDVGYTDDELWAITFNQPSSKHTEMADQLEDFVNNVRSYTGADAVSIVAHSLGVTGARYWMYEYDRYESVETFVGIAGANHGMEYARLCCRLGLDRGPYRMSQFVRSDYEAFRDHPLKELNSDETPGDIRYFTIRGEHDMLYESQRDSPRLDGADENLVLPTDHDGVREGEAAIDAIVEWLSSPDA